MDAEQEGHCVWFVTVILCLLDKIRKFTNNPEREVILYIQVRKALGSLQFFNSIVDMACIKYLR